MAEYTWIPVFTVEARQINTVEDLQGWIDSLTQNEIGPKDDYTFTNLTATAVEGGQEFLFTYHVMSQVDGDQGERREQHPYGYWAIANRVQIQFPWFEDDENFQRRFQPFNGLA